MAVMKDFNALLREKVLVFDGATGTHLQGQNLSSDDFGGEQLSGCNEYLALSRPGAVESVHRDYLDAGCDVVETNTFGSNPIVLADYGLGDRAYEVTLANARLAVRIAQEFSLPDRPRFV